MRSMRVRIPSKNEIDDFITRGVHSCIGAEHLKGVLSSGKALRIKYGIDPTTPVLHLGYFSIFRRLRWLQGLGHKIIILLGEFTARFGDPEGKLEARVMRSAKETRAYRQIYRTQLKRVFGLSAIEIRSNAKWYDSMKLDEFFRIISHATVAQMLERDIFMKLMARGKDIGLHEIIYPALQGYDSVMLESDLTVVGSDQLFNELAGRRLQEIYGQPPQDIVALEMLLGTNGEPMSQSAGNIIGITDQPLEQYGKIMSISDVLLEKYFLHLTDISRLEIKKMLRRSGPHLMDAKQCLARTIVSSLWGEGRAAGAETQFLKIFRQQELPSFIHKKIIPAKELPLVMLVVQSGLARSKSDARRVILQRGIRVDGEVVSNPNQLVSLSNSRIIQRGSRRFIKVRSSTAVA